MVKLFDRVKVNVATTGVGDVTFGAAASSAFLTPTEAGCADTDTVRYVIVDGADYEEGVGTIRSSVAVMERTTVTMSKIAGVAGTTKINLSGTAVLALVAAAADILTPAGNLAGLASVAAAQGNLGGTSVGKAVFTAADAAAARAAIGVSDARPSVQRFTSGSGTYTTPANCRWIRVTLVGAGGAGGSGGSGGSSSAGGNTTFGTLTAAGGGAGSASAGAPGSGGSSSGVLGVDVVNLPGGSGNSYCSAGSSGYIGGAGGQNALFGGGGPQAIPSGGGSNGLAGTAGTGGGGGGGSTATSGVGTGGGAGASRVVIIASPSSSYSYSIGAGGTSSGGSISNGGAGGSGIIIVEEFYAP